MPILLSFLFAASAYVIKRQRKFERSMRHYVNIVENELDEYNDKIATIAEAMIHIKLKVDEANQKGDMILEDIEKGKKVFEFMPTKNEKMVN